MKKFLSVLLLILLSGTSGWSRTLVEDSDSESTNSERRTRQVFKEADSGMALRKMRRVAVGAQAAGALGFGGALLELNLTPAWGLTTGFGGGEGFQTLEFQAKYVLTGDWLMPYMSFGYARWTSIGKSGPITRTNPSILGEKLLNGDERSAGEFQKNLLYPGIGLQFMQLTGDWAGSSLFAEVTVLLDVGNFVAAPTGTLGFLYYF